MPTESLLAVGNILSSISEAPESIEQAIWHFQYTLSKKKTCAATRLLESLSSGADNPELLDLVRAYSTLNDYYTPMLEEASKEDFVAKHKGIANSILNVLDSQELDSLTEVILRNQAALSLRNAGYIDQAKTLFEECYNEERQIVEETKECKTHKEILRNCIAHEFIGYTAFNLGRNPKFGLLDEKRFELYEDSIKSMREASRLGKQIYEDPQNVDAELAKRVVECAIDFFPLVLKRESDGIAAYMIKQLDALSAITLGSNSHLERDCNCHYLKVHELLENAGFMSPIATQYHAKEAQRIIDRHEKGTHVGEEHQYLISKHLK